MKSLNQKNSALIVIDPINHCCLPRYEDKNFGFTFKKVRKMIPHLVNFIEEYRKKFGGKIVFIGCEKWTKENLPNNLVKLYQNPFCQSFVSEQSDYSKKFYKVKPTKKDFIVYKNTYDAFSNPKLDKWLKKNKIENLIITGIFGDACVNATISGGFSKGYHFVILKDLIETSDQKDRQDLQKLLKRTNWPVLFGSTITSKQFLKKTNL